MIIWLASYPRSGNTLVRLILNNVFNYESYSKYNDLSDIANNDSISKQVGHQPLKNEWGSEYDRFNGSKELHFVKTHDRPDDSDKAIYIVRNGIFSTDSYWHYLNDFHDDSIDLEPVILGTAGHFSSWGQHLDEWGYGKRDNTLFLKYEDLLKDPEKQIQAIADFCEIKPRKKWINSFDQLHEINPKFFRRGINANENINWTDNQHDLFYTIHGDWMSVLKYRQDESGQALPNIRQFILPTKRISQDSFSQARKEYLNTIEAEKKRHASETKILEDTHTSNIAALHLNHSNMIETLNQQKQAEINTLLENQDRRYKDTLSSERTEYVSSISNMREEFKIELEKIKKDNQDKFNLQLKNEQLKNDENHKIVEGTFQKSLAEMTKEKEKEISRLEMQYKNELNQLHRILEHSQNTQELQNKGYQEKINSISKLKIEIINLNNIRNKNVQSKLLQIQDLKNEKDELIVYFRKHSLLTRILPLLTRSALPGFLSNEPITQSDISLEDSVYSNALVNEHNKDINMEQVPQKPQRPTRTFIEFFSHIKKLGFSPKTVIDVGVARGTPHLYKAFPNAYLILAEPVKDFEPYLKDIISKYTGEYHLCALMSSTGESTILKTKELHGSSMMHKVNDLNDERLQKVKIKTLDEIMGEQDREAPYLLKTDCQGGDFEVIKGGPETLKKCEVVILEVSLFKFWGNHHPDPLEILNYMSEHGFVLYDFLDGLFRPLDNALGQIDMVFVRRDGLFKNNHAWG